MWFESKYCRTEVSDLERQVAIERNKYLEFTQKSSRPSVLPYLAIKNSVSIIYNFSKKVVNEV